MKIDTSPEALAALKEDLSKSAHGELAQEARDVIAALEARCAQIQFEAITLADECDHIRAERDALQRELKTEQALSFRKQVWALEAERDAALADAKRYRFLRDREWPFEFKGSKAEDADAAIDAALAEAKP